MLLFFPETEICGDISWPVIPKTSCSRVRCVLHDPFYSYEIENRPPEFFIAPISFIDRFVARSAHGAEDFLFIFHLLFRTWPPVSCSIC